MLQQVEASQPRMLVSQLTAPASRLKEAESPPKVARSQPGGLASRPTAGAFLLKVRRESQQKASVRVRLAAIPVRHREIAVVGRDERISI